MEQPEEPAAEPEPERGGGLRLVDERRIVELELVEGVAQVRVVRTVDRVEPREDHRLGVPVTAQRRRRRLAGVGDGVADPRLAHVLDTGDEVADLADTEPLGRHRLRRDHPDLEELVGRPRRHHDDPLARVEVAVDDPDVGDDPAVGVIDRVEDHRPGRGSGVAHRSRYLADDLVEQGLDPLAGLAGDPEDVPGVAADEPGQLDGILLGLGRREVDLVEHRDDRQVVLHREIEVRQRLCLDPLCRVDEQDGPLAGGERAGDLVAEVDVPRCVDHVEDELLGPSRGVDRPPGHPHGLGLDGDAPLALDVHPVEVLRPHGPAVDDPGDLEDPVGEGRLAVVDVGDDAEVADRLGRGRVRGQRGSGTGGHGVVGSSSRGRRFALQSPMAPNRVRPGEAAVCRPAGQRCVRRRGAPAAPGRGA